MKATDLVIIGGVAYGAYWLSQQSLTPNINLNMPNLPTVPNFTDEMRRWQQYILSKLSQMGVPIHGY